MCDHDPQTGQPRLVVEVLVVSMPVMYTSPAGRLIRTSTETSTRHYYVPGDSEKPPPILP